jgi:hypothetical protein
MKKEAAIAALGLLLGLSSCDLLPMAKREFDMAIAGPPSAVFDDFEIADGSLPGKYAWKIKQGEGIELSSPPTPPSISSAWSFSGGRSLSFNSTFSGNLYLAAAFPAGTRIHYIARKMSDYLPLSSLNILQKVDNTFFQAPPTATWTMIDDDVYEVSFTFDGCRKGLEFNGNNLYVDDLCINPPSLAGCAPAAEAVLPRAPVGISWPAVPGASSYRLQISSTRKFATPLVDLSGLAPTSTSYLFQPGPQASEFYWRLGVDGLNSYGTVWLPPSHAFLYSDWKDESFEGMSLPPPEWIAVPNSASIVSGNSGSGSNCLLFNPGSANAAARLRRLARFASGGFIGFRYRFDSSTNLMVCVDGAQAAMQPSSYYSWADAIIAVPEGSHSIEFAAQNSSPVYLDSFSFFQNDALLASQDFEASATLPACLTLAEGSAAISAAAPHGGSACLQIGKGSDAFGSVTALSSLASPKYLRFFLKLDASADDFYVYIDGSYVLRQYPQSWTQCSVSIPAGAHRVEFRFASYGTGRYAYLDDLILE